MQPTDQPSSSPPADQLLLPAASNTEAESTPSGSEAPAPPAPYDVQQRLPRRTYAVEAGQITRDVIESYLSRAITMQGMADDVMGGGTDVTTTGWTDAARLALIDAVRADDIRFIFNVGAKFIGRAAGVWNEWQEAERFARAAATAALVHNTPDGAEIILQAGIFEHVDPGMMRDPGRQAPRWAQEEIYGPPPVGSPYALRPFRVLHTSPTQRDGMQFDNYNPALRESSPHAIGATGMFWDVSKPEAQMWVFYRAVRYIDAGYEALHFGQVEATGENDPGGAHWWGVLRRIRAFAAGRLPLYDAVLGRALRAARRGFVLCDGHTDGLYYAQALGAARPYQLIFDYNAYPLRMTHYRDNAFTRGNTFPAPTAEIRYGVGDAIYGRSRGGYAPLPPHEGYQYAPFLVEFDNYPLSDTSDQPYTVWGFDEITWFGAYQYPQAGPNVFQSSSHSALPNAAARNQYLRDLWRQVRRLDGNGWLQLPARRSMVLNNGNGPTTPRRDALALTYRANSASAPWPLNTPRPPHYGEQEQTIQEIFAGALNTWEEQPLGGYTDVAGDVLTADGKVFYRNYKNQLCNLYRDTLGPNDVAPKVVVGAIRPEQDVRGPVVLDAGRARFF